MSDKKATLLLFSISLMWATSFIFSSIAMESGMSGVEVVFGRFFISTASLYIIFRKKLRFKNLEKNAIKVGMISGGVTFFGFYFEMMGIKLSNTTKAGFLTGLSVIILPFLYLIIFKQKPKVNSIVAGVLTILGVALLSLKDSFIFEIGDILLIITAFFYAFNSTIVSSQSKGCSMFQLTYVQFFTVAVLTGCVLPFSRGESFTREGILATLYLAIIPTIVCYLIKNYLLKFVSPVRCSIVQTSQSIFCAVLSVAILGDVITGKMFLGMVVIMGAILIEIALPSIKSFKKENAVLEEEEIEINEEEIA